MDLNIPGPAEFLYMGKWSAKCDNTLVKCLVTLKSQTQWTLKHFPSWFLLTAQRQIEQNVGVFFFEAELIQRVDLLHTRYKTFKAAVKHNGSICLKNKFTGAYYYHDEPIYTSLACLFGMEDVKVEVEMEVIDRSDSIVKIIFDDTMTVDIDDNDEEVNSPAVFWMPNVKHKLFADEEMPTDRESSTDKGSYFIDLATRDQLQPRVEMSRALPKPTTFVGCRS